MEFIPLYYADKLINNRSGDIAVVTCWTDPKTVLNKLQDSPVMDRIAVLGRLYGNGMPELLRNLLYNPQIKYLYICGKDLSGSKTDLINFFTKGVEVASNVPLYQIVGSTRKLDTLVSPDMFNITVLDCLDNVPDYIETCVERKNVSLPEHVLTNFPANTCSTTVYAENCSEGWNKICQKVKRFGVPVELKKGKRIELLNVVCVIEKHETVDTVLVKNYCQSLLEKELPSDLSYTYGNRMRKYFGLDCLEQVIERLKKDCEARTGWITTWDPYKDSLADSVSHPCLVSLFFRRYCNKLTLTATFRTHNLLSSWLLNVLGLQYVQRYVASQVRQEIGQTIIVSNSLTIDPKDLNNCPEPLPYHFYPDPCGNLTFSYDSKIVCCHYYEGMLLTTYYANSVEAMKKQLIENNVISTIEHAIWVGQELEKIKEMI